MHLLEKLNVSWELIPLKQHLKTYTADGVRVRILVNINLLNEIEVAKGLKAEGIGLYRSEFPFIVRNTISIRRRAI